MKPIYEACMAVMILAIVICIILTRKNKEKLAKALRWLLIIAGLTMAANGLYVVSVNVGMATLFFGLFSAMIDWLLLQLLNYSLLYTDMNFESPALRILAYAVALADTVSMLVNSRTSHVFKVGVAYFAILKGKAFSVTSNTIFYYLHLAFCYIICIFIFVILLRKLIKTAAFYRKKYSVILICFVILLSLDGATLLIESPYNFSMFAYCITSIMITYFSLAYIPKTLVQGMQKLVVEGMENIVVCFDSGGHLIFANDRANQIIEYSGNSDFISKKYREWKAVYFEKEETKSSWQEESFITGELHYTETVATKLFDDNDRYIGVYFISYDRTEEHNRHQREIDQEKEQGEKRGRFWATIAHEMRTPMNSILGMNELILREAQKPEILGYAESVRTATDTLIGLINDVLDFSKIDAGKMELREEEYKVLHLLKNINTIILPKAMEKGLEFHIEVDDFIPTALMGDELRIQQIIINLLTNAIKYTEQGSVTLRLFSERRYEDFYLHVEVEDTGIGMREESLPLLFEAYERVNEAKVHGIQGTGLGINICSSLLRLMDSKLEVESTYGKGSVFSFAIKQPPMSMRYVENAEQLLRGPAEVQKHKSELEIQSGNLLIVDDNDMNREVFKALLKKSGLTITDAAGGQDALELMRSNTYDLIFLDHLMPGMDGLEVLKHMKSDEACKNAETPVVMMTANAMEGAKEEFLEAGFDDYLAKPVRPEALEETIAKWLKKE